MDAGLYYKDAPPELPVLDEFASSLGRPDAIPYEISMYLDPDLRLSWEKWIDRWHEQHTSGLQVKFHPGGRVIEDDPKKPPHIRSGEIIVYCQPGVKEDFAFAQRLFRLLKRFATNVNQICYSYPEYDVRWTQEKGNLNWLGHDAIRWARADERRMLCYDSRGWGIRPNDKRLIKPCQGG